MPKFPSSKYSPITIGSHPGGLGEVLLGFGQDLSGEIYVLTSGKVFKIVPPAG